MKVSRKHGRLRLRLDPVENGVLADLFDQMDAAYTSTAAEDPVIGRLFPSAYPDDEDADREYRELTQSGLRSERQERIAACRADLAAGTDIDLADPDAARRWIQVLNDLRLAIGTRLGITEDDEPPARPSKDPRFLYYWLTAMQDSVVQELMH